MGDPVRPWDVIEETSSESSDASDGGGGGGGGGGHPAQPWDVIEESSSDSSDPLPLPKAKGRPKKIVTKYPRKPSRASQQLLPLDPSLSSQSDWAADHFVVLGGDVPQLVARCIKAPVLDDAANEEWVSHFMGMRPRKNLPVGAEVSLLNTYHAKFKRNELSLGATVYWATRLYWSSLLSRAMSDIYGERRRGLAIFSYLQCDETDMAIGVEQKRPKSSASSVAPSVGAVAPAASPAASPKSSAPRRHKKRQRKRGKIEQTEWTVGMLMEEVGSGKLAAVFGEIPCPLQHADSNASECLKVMLQRQLDFPMLQGMQARFKYFFKVSTMDRAASNLKYQQAERDENSNVFTVFLALFCAVHVIHTAFGLGLLDMNRIISGSIALAFVLSQSAGRESFMEAGRKVLKERLVIVAGGVPPSDNSESTQWTAAVLRAYCDAVPTAAARDLAVRLRHLFRGDWQQREIPVYVSSELSEDEVHAVVEEWLDEATDALFSLPIPIFARSRWCTSAKVSAPLFLLTQINDLLPDVEILMLELMGYKLQGPEQRDDDLVIEETAIVVQAAADADSYWASFNSKARSNVEKMSRDVLLGFSTVFWLHGLQPVIVLLQHLLHVGSGHWEKLEVRKALQQQRRNFRILLASNGEVLKAFKRSYTDVLHTAAHWYVLPKKFYYVRYRSLIWAWATRPLGAILLLLEAAWLAYPYRLFLLLDPSRDLKTTAEMLERDPECLLDDFARAFKSIFPKAVDLMSERCLAILVCLALLVRLDTSRIEARHAALRRLLLSKGSTWVNEFGEVSAGVILRYAQQLLTQFSNDCQTNVNDVHREQSKGLGTQQAFLSQWLREHPLSGFGNRKEWFQAAGQAWKEFKAGASGERVAYFQKLAAAMRTAAAAPGSRTISTLPATANADFEKRLMESLPHFGSHTVVACDESWTELRARAQKTNQNKKRLEIETNKMILQWSKEQLDGGSEGQQLKEFFGEVLTSTDKSGMQPRPQAYPGSQMTVAEVFVPLPELAKKLLDNATPAEIDKLLEEWEKLHKCVRHSDCPKIQKEKKKRSKSICFWARLCVCYRDDLRLFVKKLMASTRALCAPHTRMRQMLQQGSIVFCLRSFSNTGESDFCFYYYIAYANLTTFRAAVIPLRLDDEYIQSALAQSLSGVALLPAAWPELEWGTWWQIMLRLDLSLHLMLDMLMLSSAMIPIDSVCPASILAEPLDHPATPLKFWHGPPPPKKRSHIRSRRRASDIAPPIGGPGPEALPLEDEDPGSDEESSVPDDISDSGTIFDPLDDAILMLEELVEMAPPESSSSEEEDVKCGGAASSSGGVAAGGPPFIPPPPTASASSSSSVAPPPPPPPPPPAPPAGPAAHKPKNFRRGKFPQILSPLGNGYLRRSSAVGAGPDDPEDMRAVCWRHENCTISRGCGPEPGNAATGRPAGLLWAFLQYAHLYDDKTRHKEAQREWGTWPKRLAARNDVMTMPEWNVNWSVAERLPTGEDTEGEPAGFAGGLTPEARALDRALAAV